eukprot:Selendium_serpulae@DN4478_c0_g1_i1.p1
MSDIVVDSVGTYWVPHFIVGVLLFIIALVFGLGRRQPSATFLNRTLQQLTLSKKIRQSCDTWLFEFALPQKNMLLGLPTGKHVTIFAPNRKGIVEGEWNGRADKEKGAQINRKYTPVSPQYIAGKVEFLIKVYRKGAKAQWVDGGKVSQHFDSLEVGDQIKLEGPYGAIEYFGEGQFLKYNKPLKSVNEIGMIAGGSGITPMLQVIAHVVSEKGPEPRISLIYANQSVDDILLKRELDSFALDYPDKFKVHYTVDKLSDEERKNWNGSVGFVTKDMIQTHLPGSGDSIALLCGPKPMTEGVCKTVLSELGYADTSILEF